MNAGIENEKQNIWHTGRIGTLLGTLGCNGCREEPKTAYAAGDLNKEGVADIIVEAPAFGYYHNRIPLYGVEKDGSVIYVSADEIKSYIPSQ